MDVGIGVPTSFETWDREAVRAWIQECERWPFRSLVVGDRVALADPLPLLAFAAGLTERLRLVTCVLLAPLRNPVLLAREIATIDRLCGGRVVVGIGVGSRESDYAIVGEEFSRRGKKVEEVIATMRRVWREGGIGPRPVQEGGPPILLAGIVPRALERAARLGDGYIAAGVEQAAFWAQQVRRLWHERGRTGEPQFKGTAYFALGEEAARRGRAHLEQFFSFSPQLAERVARGLVSTPQEVRALLHRYQEAGYDEVFFYPTVPDREQIERLAESLP
jgi:alkanesulfonate monooxygenase SsuD/methylene tetrahydromethanopterin reductase-like flavin-dependent oxidoreductase (luciferase family)